MEHGKNPVIAGIVVIAVIAVLVGGVIVLGKKDDKTTESASAPATTQSTDKPGSATTPEDTASATSNGTYKDGTYEATGSYKSPGGTEKITIKVTIANNIITDTEAAKGSTSRTSEQYQSEFVAGYKKQVVGKKVDEVELSKISGSSLTPKGFNDALDEIRNEARG